MESIDKIIQQISTNIQHWMTPEILTKCLGMIDLTTLKSEDTYKSVTKFVEKVNGFKEKFPLYPNPASICVYPNFSKTIKDTLTAKDVAITVVSGCFPASQSYLEVKCLEAKMAVENGANEVDIVLALNSFLDGDFDTCREEISQIKKTIGDAHLKVILETGIIHTEEKISNASLLAMESGADFIKTSTGKIDPSATPFAAVVMCNSIKDFYKKTGKKIGFKPAGGISTAKDAAVYYAIVETILGNEWLNPTLLRFGASRVANNLLSEIENKTIIYY